MYVHVYEYVMLFMTFKCTMPLKKITVSGRNVLQKSFFSSGVRRRIGNTYMYRQVSYIIEIGRLPQLLAFGYMHEWFCPKLGLTTGLRMLMHCK